MEALELIEKLKKAYGAADTYRDVGITLATDAKTDVSHAPRQHFKTYFRKPASYRCECHYELPDDRAESATETPGEMAQEATLETRLDDSPTATLHAQHEATREGTREATQEATDEDTKKYHQQLLATDGVLWCDGNESKHYSRLADKVEIFQDAASLFGPSLDPIFKGKAQVPDLVARMLMPSIFKDYDQFPLAKEYWSVVGDELVDNVLCVQITQDLMVYKETLWIAKRDYTLRQHSRDIDYSFLDHPRVKSLIDTGSKMMRYFFKQFPDINKEILDRGPRHYRTQFLEIAINDPIEDDQLAFR
jgi:hypothetical protein